MARRQTENSRTTKQTVLSLYKTLQRLNREIYYIKGSRLKTTRRLVSTVTKHLRYIHYFGNESSKSLSEAHGIVTKEKKLLADGLKPTIIV
jgi:hypothetical protein